MWRRANVKCRSHPNHPSSNLLGFSAALAPKVFGASLVPLGFFSSISIPECSKTPILEPWQEGAQEGPKDQGRPQALNRSILLRKMLENAYFGALAGRSPGAPKRPRDGPRPQIRRFWSSGRREPRKPQEAQGRPQTSDTSIRTCRMLEDAYFGTLEGGSPGPIEGPRPRKGPQASAPLG